MRILSQDGMTDLPYESVGVGINNIDNNEIIAYRIGDSNDFFWVMARYSSKDKAMKAMDILQASYMANETLKIMNDYQKIFLSNNLNKIESESMYGIFQFPTEAEIDERKRME